MDGKEHYDRALAIYESAEDGLLMTRSGRDVGVTLLSFRSLCVQQLGYTAVSLSDAELAVKNARETGQATTLMYALFAAATNHIRCGNYAAAHTQVDELMALETKEGRRTGKPLEPQCGVGSLPRPEKLRMQFGRSPRGSHHSGQLEQLFMNRGICGIWQWLTRSLASLTMLGIALTTR